MKNIIIVGPPRAGKSTLAKKINEELNYFVINADKIVAAFGRAYPQLDIRLNWYRKKTTDNVAPFLGHFLGVFSTSHQYADNQNLQLDVVKGNKFVLEGAYFNFEKVLSIMRTYEINDWKDHFILIGLVQNKKTVDEFIKDFKKYDTEVDWSYGFDDIELGKISEQTIKFSREMTDYLIKYDFTIYDTSYEREQVLDKIIADIKLKLH
jgi:hypothetical protein